MINISPLENRIQQHAWGDRKALFDLFGIVNPTNEPLAEIWMGAHPKAPSMIFDGISKITFNDLIEANPEAILGSKVASVFDKQLPFLFKVLAVAKPLSIQAHPVLSQAKEGFSKENLAKIPLNAYNRNYKDDHHKPELICALTPFRAMSGFRDIEEIIRLLENLSTPILEKELSAFKSDPTKKGLKQFYTWMLNLSADQVIELTTDAINITASKKGDLAFENLLYLNSYYPNDIGIMCALLLNHVELQPGEAMFLDAGEIHAYLHGVGMEIMANSDNVLRGGLTPKYVDIPEFLKTLSFNSVTIDILTPQKTNNSAGHIYPTPAKEFEFSVMDLTEATTGNQSVDFVIDSVEIIFCTQGSGMISAKGIEIALSRGQSFLIPASVVSYTISGQVKIFKASVPFIMY